jgi:ubiquinone/menaquinone biosynthesis C-methylase UbiE/ADP-ribose pyrophosphatase YjhB (NUDIX family)
MTAGGTEPMPQILSAALLADDGAVLVAHRKQGRRPFAGQWLLPSAIVAREETAEDALDGHMRAQFGVAVAGESFADTVYLEDPDGGERYIANIFHTRVGSGALRFRADGEYDDARWLAAAEIEQLWMPPPLRESVVRLLAEEAEPRVENDWTVTEGVPLAERPTPPAETAEPPVADVPREPEEESPPPDNRAGWDAISAAYQAQYYGDRDVGRLKWSWGIFEDELQLLGDVRGKRAIVLGCGGGQDCVALDRMGAVAVGVDVSAKQVEYARKYATRHSAQNVSFVEGSVDDLSRFDDASFDLAVSIHALGYVEQIDAALGEAARVLKPGGVLAVSVPHPFDQTLSDDAPYRVTRSYWHGDIDWDWTFDNAQGRFRDYRRTMSQWFAAFTDAGFTVERLAEPYQGGAEDDAMRGVAIERARLIPYVLILKGRR